MYTVYTPLSGVRGCSVIAHSFNQSEKFSNGDKLKNARWAFLITCASSAGLLVRYSPEFHKANASSKLARILPRRAAYSISALSEIKDIKCSRGITCNKSSINKLEQKHSSNRVHIKGLLPA